MTNIIEVTTTKKVYQLQKTAYLANPYPDYQERYANLQKLENLLKDNSKAIADAINEDFGNRSVYETKMLELFGLVDGIKYTRKHLKRWMKAEKRKTSLWFFGAKNKVFPQPKGLVGIISPWNYPLFLCISPLTSALAAGNRVMIKMATHSQTLCGLIAELTAQIFDKDTVTILPGVSAKEFTNVPYDHLVFTGSAAVGRQVMQKAAQFLTPVTLELGGKSPCIVAEDFDLELACERILQGKLYNAGQTCVAPDYLFVPKNKVDAFIDHAKTVALAHYPDLLHNNDFTSIIDRQAYERLLAGLDDARRQGAEIINLSGDNADADLKKIPPYLVIGGNTDMTMMQDEIFGPILPIRTYQNIDEVIDFINQRERPLALYLFSHNKTLQDKIINNILSGGVCINDVMMHVAQHDLPFGGIGTSGMGQYHAHEGFLELSKLRPIMQQAARPSTKYMKPPYGKTMHLLLRMMLGKHR